MKHFNCYPVAVTLFFAAMLSFVAPSLRAQEVPLPDPTREYQHYETRLLAGISVLGGINAYSAGIPMVYAPICNRLEDGIGFGYGAGLTVEYLLSPAVSLTMHTRYGSWPGSFRRLEPIGRWADAEGEGYIVANIESQIQYEALEADVMLKWGGRIMGGGRNRLGVAVGPSLSLPIKAGQSQEHVLKFYNTGGTFLTQRSLEELSGEELRRKTLADHEDMPRMKWQRYGLRGGLFLDYDLGSGIYVTPGFYADFPLTNFTDFEWGALSLYHLQVDLTVGI